MALLLIAILHLIDDCAYGRQSIVDVEPDMGKSMISPPRLPLAGFLMEQ